MPAGGTVIYHCPGLKSFKNETDWTVTCSPDTSEFEWTPPLLIWPGRERVDGINEMRIRDISSD